MVVVVVLVFVVVMVVLVVIKKHFRFVRIPINVIISQDSI